LSTLIGIFVAFAFFDWPWRGLILVAFLLFDALEIWVWMRWRKQKSITGVESIIGKKGTATTNLQPEGRVRVASHDWKAESIDGPIGAGEEIEVTGSHSIKLIVRRAS
jgi:membrane protein implicated in regulation of membrane protease activity